MVSYNTSLVKGGCAGPCKRWLGWTHNSGKRVLWLEGTVKLAYMYTCLNVYLPMCMWKLPEQPWFHRDKCIPFYLTIVNKISWNIHIARWKNKASQGRSRAGGSGCKKKSFLLEIDALCTEHRSSLPFHLLSPWSLSLPPCLQWSLVLLQHPMCRQQSPQNVFRK